MAERVVGTINMDLRCPRCRKKGAVERSDGSVGPCLKCIVKLMIARRTSGEGRRGA